MPYRLLGILAALMLVGLSSTSASAKTPSFIIAGGELGEYAAVVWAPWPEGSYIPEIGAPTSQLVRTNSPPPTLSLRYDLYGGSPFTAVYGPDYHYYPAERFLHETERDRWYQVLPDWAAFLESAIEEALAERERGGLEIGAIAAGLRQYHLPDSTMWLRPYEAGDEIQAASPLSFGRCSDCVPFTRGPEQFVIQDMVATLSETPVAGGPQRHPSYTLEYYASYGNGGSGGVAGFYAPPVDSEKGRFWPPAYIHDTGVAYFETTPGFDQTIINEFAFWQTAAGNLEEWVSAAKLRNMRLPEATFLLRRFAIPGEGYNFQGSGECPRCLVISGPNEAFVLGDLAEVMVGPLLGPAAEMPPYAIEYQIPNPPDGFIRETLGMYRPPEDGAPGQFWFRQYSRASLYYETTSGFDAVLARALNIMPPEQRAPAATDQLLTESEDSLTIWIWLSVGVVIAVAMLYGGVVRVLRGKRG